MMEVLGIRLKPEVLPFSNIPAFLPPFWLSRNSAMAVARPLTAFRPDTTYFCRTLPVREVWRG